MSKLTPTVFIVLITFAIFILTKNPFTGPYKLQMALLSLLSLIIFALYVRKEGQALTSHKGFIFLLTATILFLVGATGWFFSPFFFTLYLMTIVLVFILGRGASLGFVISLIVLFSFNIGEVDLAYDFLVVLSLLTSIPISLYLRKEYLRLAENEKRILILEKEKQEVQDTLSKLLANTVNFTSAELREPLVNIKNYTALLLERGQTEVSQIKDGLQKIYQSALIALKVVDKFEEEVTGKRIKDSA